MLSPGDRVDVLIPEHGGNKNKIHKYKALKVLAIDGVSKQNQGSDLLGGLNPVGGLLSPKNVTLEVQEDRVEEMLKRAGGNGIILSLRSQFEETKNAGEETTDEESTVVRNAMLKNIADMGRLHTAEVLRETKRRKDEEARNLSALMSNINMIGAGTAADAVLNARRLREAEEKSLSMIMRNINAVGVGQTDIASRGEFSEGSRLRGGKYEVVSGRIVGEEEEPEPEENFVTIYRKLQADEVQFDEQGKKLDKRAMDRRMRQQQSDGKTKQQQSDGKAKQQQSDGRIRQQQPDDRAEQ
jgi:hypothetical protein